MAVSNISKLLLNLGAGDKAPSASPVQGRTLHAFSRSCTGGLAVAGRQRSCSASFTRTLAVLAWATDSKSRNTGT